jgi:hypothetical protein
MEFVCTRLVSSYFLGLKYFLYENVKINKVVYY